MLLLFPGFSPFASAGVEQRNREFCCEFERSECERPRFLCGTQVLAQRAEASRGRFLLVPFSLSTQRK